MHEHDRIGVNIVVTGISAAAGFAVGGPDGAAVGAVLPEVVREITSRRVRNVESVADDACELAGLTGPELVDWVSRMHAGGALICSACSGIFLLAETGLFDGADATVHFGYAGAFAAAFPQVPIHPERVLVVSGRREELISSGASMTWHDLVLYLIARHAGATAAQTIARFFALQWHQDGLAPYIVFEGRKDHGDTAIQTAQDWVATHFSVANPLEEMILRAGLTGRTFKRRFTAAAGVSPIAYVQRLRIEEAKRRLEGTEASVDEISWQVGYEEPAFFRRLFKRVTGLAPGAYRRRFQIPEFARSDKNT